MKKITHKLSLLELASLATLILFSTFIWIAGPDFTLANTHPLLEPEKRFGIIVVLFLGWLLLSLLYTAPIQQKENTQKATPSPDILKKLQSLQGRFQGAIEFLKKTVMNNQGRNVNLSHLPWYLMIGPKSSGKTTLLAHADLNFILSKKFKPELLKSMPPSEACDWWATRDLVLVDVPSSYIQTPHKPIKAHPRNSLRHILWQSLLTLIQDHRKTESINGIIITLHLPELMQKSQEHKQLISDIKQRINELRTYFGKRLPFYIVLTKSDLLPGFLEFFGDSSSDELAQMWGITLPALRPGDKLSELVSHRFNALIKRLNKQLLWRLHKERNNQARALIKDFPLHIEHIKDHLIQFIKALSISDLSLHGIFFTSSMQPSQSQPATHTQNTSMTLNTHHQALQILQPTSLPNKPYFIRQLLTQALFHTQEHNTIHQHTTTTSHWPQWATYVISVSTILFVAFFLGYDFRQSMRQAHLIQNNLAQYQLNLDKSDPQSNHLINAIPLLDALEQACNSAGPKLSRLANHLAFYSKKSKKTADDVYSKALQTIVLPEIKSTLETYLQNTNHKNPTQSYAVLKAYLMLGDAQNLQVDFVTHIMKQLITASGNKQALDDLDHHINAAFSLTQQPLQLDNNLINNVRKQLANLVPTDLAYVILKNMYNNNSDSPITLGTDPKNASVFVSKELANQIPNMFTAEGFKTILTGELSVAATEALQGNWVLGTFTPSSVDPAILANQLYTQYVTNYIDVWESQLANIQLYSPQTLPELNTMLETITSNKSPLLQMLQTIQQNTMFDAVTTASPKLQAFDALLANASNNHDNYLYQMFLSLRELNTYINTITHTNNLGSAAFQASKQHLQKTTPDALANINSLAQQIPEPMKTWLTTLSTQSWNLISQETAHYIDSEWQKNIMSTYHSQIANRFPFTRNATQDVNLQSFTQFLGQQGALSLFYQTYLKPFIDDSQPSESHWRTVDNQKLPLKDDIIAEYQTITKLQRAFFPNGDNQLFVQFTLQPISLEPNIKSFSLAINGQKMDQQKDDANSPHVFSWPGNNNATHTTTIHFITPNNKLISESFQGDWGWFRLAEKATQTVNSRKEISLNFDIDGHSAKYSLFTQGHLNPFLPSNLEQFQLPETLV